MSAPTPTKAAIDILAEAVAHSESIASFAWLMAAMAHLRGLSISCRAENVTTEAELVALLGTISNAADARGVFHDE